MVTRRAVLGVAAGIAAGMALPGDAAAGGLMVGDPRWGARVDATRFPLTHLVLRWPGEVRPGLRLRRPSGWGEWSAVADGDGGRDGRPAGLGHALVAVAGAVGYEVAPSGVVVTELNTSGGPLPAADPLTIGRRRLPIRFYRRAGWSANESLRFQPDGNEIWSPEYYPVQTLTVHHTVTTNADPDPAATVRAIYYYHAVTLEFGDVGYHLLIDESGAVYEGRWSGPDPVPVFGGETGTDLRPKVVNAGHVAGYNAGNIGVALLGDFTSRLPTPAARASLTRVLAAMAGISGLDPLSTTRYVNPISGATRTVETISGHSDWQPTECPGILFHPQLPSLRRDVLKVIREAA